MFCRGFRGKFSFSFFDRRGEGLLDSCFYYHRWGIIFRGGGKGCWTNLVARIFLLVLRPLPPLQPPRHNSNSIDIPINMSITFPFPRKHVFVVVSLHLLFASSFPVRAAPTADSVGAVRPPISHTSSSSGGGDGFDVVFCTDIVHSFGASTAALVALFTFVQKWRATVGCLPDRNCYTYVKINAPASAELDWGLWGMQNGETLQRSAGSLADLKKFKAKRFRDLFDLENIAAGLGGFSNDGEPGLRVFEFDEALVLRGGRKVQCGWKMEADAIVQVRGECLGTCDWGRGKVSWRGEVGRWG